MIKIPLSQPDITQTEIDLINQVLATPYLSMGPMIERFEEAMARYLGSPHAVAVSSGTAGLHLAIIAAGIGEGDEVITTPFSFVASANCILYERARPIFVDVELQTMGLDPEQVEAAITPRTRAILPVHVFGQPCLIADLTDIARRHDLFLIEDACEAIGAKFDGQAVGTFSDCAVFGFYPNKQMTTGEGGIIVTSREDWARIFRSLRNQGRDDDGSLPRHIRLGYNYRLDELSAALGLAQVERLEELLSKRQRVAEWYTARLREMVGLEVPFMAPRTTRMSWFVYVVRLAPTVDRDAVMHALQVRGVPSRPYFTPIHLHPFYRERFGYREGDFPVSEAVARRTLALPFSGVMTEEQVNYVCQALEEAIKA